jgi:N utilization substance protein B
MSAASHSDRSLARELAVQFLYQSEAEKLFHYSESHLQSFVNHLQVPPHLVGTLRQLVKGTFDLLPEIDPSIQDASANWKISRMPMVDRNALRLAVYELMATDTPDKVVLNEAIEIAKKFGSGESGAFVNGILDRIVRTRRATKNP